MCLSDNEIANYIYNTMPIYSTNIAIGSYTHISLLTLNQNNYKDVGTYVLYSCRVISFTKEQIFGSIEQ